MANRFLNNIRINDEYTLPSTDGDADQIIQTDGAGNLSFVDLSSIEGASSNFVYFEVKNETGSTINKGKGVMAVGTDGNSGHILIDEMIADGSIEAKYFLGVLETTVANGGFARVISFGQLDQFNTNGQNGETWNDGDILWCDPDSEGDFTITEPDGPNVKIAAAIVLNAATNGKIQIRVQANEGIHDLHDTKITSQVDGDVLVWDDTTGVWFNDSTLNVDYANARVGIGTTSPSAKLHIQNGSSGQSTPNSVANGLVIETGSSTAAGLSILSPSTTAGNIFFGDESDNYVGGFRYYHNINEMSVNVNNAEAIRIDSSRNVGIGTTSPSQKLHVSGNARVTGAYYDSNNSAGTSGQVLSSTATGTDWVSLSEISGVDGTGTANYVAKWSDSDTITNSIIYDNGTNVGIVTTSPLDKLHVEGGAVRATGGTANGKNIRFYVNDSWGYLTTTAPKFYLNTEIRVDSGLIGSYNESLQLRTSGTTRMYIDDSSGNVGIGTTSPSVQLDIEDSSNVLVDLNTTTANANTTIRFQESGSNTATIGYDGTNDGLILTTGGFTAGNGIFIDDSQNVGIGTSSPENLLHVQQTGLYSGIHSTAGIRVKSDGASGLGNYHGTIALSKGTGSVAISAVQEASDSDVMGMAFFTHPSATGSDASVEQMRIDQNGNVGIGTSSPSAAGGYTPILHLSASYPALAIENTATGSRKYQLGVDSVAAFNIYDANASSNRLTITSSGNVGIGTTSPSEKLSVAGNIALVSNNSFISFNTSASSGDPKIQMGSDGDFSFLNTAGSNNLHIENGGNVGIGTTSPSYKLSVNGNIQTDIINGYTYPNNSWLDFDYDQTLASNMVALASIGTIVYLADTNNNASASAPAHLFTTASGDVDSATRLLNINTNGAIQFNQYGSGTFTGTATQRLGVDSSGNVIEIPIGSGAVDGSGTTNYVAKWSDADTITNSVIYDNGTNVGIGTTNPDAPLTIHNSTDPEIRFGYSSTQDHKIQWDSSKVFIYADPENTNGSSALGLGVDGSLGFYMDSSRNVGIGTTSPSDRLDVTDGNAKMVFGAASSDRPWIYFQHNAVPVDGEEIGLLDFRGYNSASQDTRYVILTAKAEDVTDGSEDGSLTFQTMKDGTATQAMTLKSGNVGIGTTDPQGPLHSYINANRQMGHNSVGGDLGVISDNNSAPVMYIKGTGTADLLNVFDNTTEVFTIKDGGNVGIGTTSPAAEMHISSGASRIRLTNDLNQTWQIGTDNVANGFFSIKDITDSRDVLVLTGDGNVGVGTTSPSEKLEVAGNILVDNGDGGRILINNGAQSVAALGDLGSGTDGQLALYNSSGTLTTVISGDSSSNSYINAGNVGIGTTSPGTKLDVIGVVRSQYSSTRYAQLESNASGGVLKGVGGNGFLVRSYGASYFNGGNFGIGTTSPDYKLDVAGAIGINTYIHHNDDTDTFIGYSAANTFEVNAGGVKQLSVTSDNVNITDTLSYTYPTATGEYNGEIVTFGTFDTKNGAIAEGDVIVYTTAGLNTGWMRAQGNVTYSKGMLGIAMGTSASDGILIKGFARNTAFASGSLGSPLYLSPTSAGDTTSVIPSSTNNIVRIVGYMLNPTNDEIFFDPDKSWVQVS